MTRLTMPRLPSRLRAGSRSGGGSSLLLLTPAFALLIVLFGSILLFAMRALFPDSTGTIGAFEAILDGALDGFFWSSMLRTVLLALIAAALSACIALVVVDTLVMVDRTAVTVVTLILLFTPLVISMAVRGYGWLLILDQKAVSSIVSVFGERLAFLGLDASMLSVVVVMTHALMPLTALPLLTRLREIHGLRVTSAAHDLGASGFRVFCTVTVPLAAPTVLRVMGLTLALSMGAFGIPAIIGRGRVQVVSELVYQNLLAVDWAGAFVRLMALLIVAGLIISPLLYLAARLGRRNQLTSEGEV